MSRGARGGDEPSVGSILGNYKLQALIGQGGMGRVFKARHVRLGRTVAIKVLDSRHSRQEDMVKRFFREAQVINEISHHNIVDVTDFLVSDGHAYCVMEYLVGQSLGELLKRRYVPVAETLRIMRQVADALQAAHDHDVVHRDLKPDNIFLLKKRDAGGQVVKVLDFGVAKLMDGNATNYTAEGMVVGTPAFMAPEQASGLEIDPRTDIYAFGVVLYRMLSGEMPFRAGNFSELLVKLTTQDPPPLPKSTPRGEAIPPALAKAVMQCLEKKPKDRPQKMAALSELLGSLEAPSPKAVRNKGRRAAGKRATRVRRQSAARVRFRLAALLVAGVLAAAGWRERATVLREATRLKDAAADKVQEGWKAVQKRLPGQSAR